MEIEVGMAFDNTENVGEGNENLLDFFPLSNEYCRIHGVGKIGWASEYES